MNFSPSYLVFEVTLFFPEIVMFPRFGIAMEGLWKE
jgi:hypothetical protein